jgi:hypothetical protein
LCAKDIFLLNLKDLRPAGCGVKEESRKKGYGDTGVVTTNREVYQIPALFPGSKD